MYDIIEKVELNLVALYPPAASDHSVLQEKTRQRHFINLIPSENFTSQAVLDALGSPMQSTTKQSVTGAVELG